MVIKKGCYLFRYRDATELYISAGNAFSKRHNIRFYIEMFKSKHLTRAAPSRHDFITNHHNTEFITDFANPLQITFRRNNKGV